MTQHLSKQRPRFVRSFLDSSKWQLLTMPLASVEVLRRFSNRDFSCSGETPVLCKDAVRVCRLLFRSNRSIVSWMLSVPSFDSFSSVGVYSSISGSAKGEWLSTLSGVYGSYRLPCASAVFKLRRCVSTRFTIMLLDRVIRFDMSVLRSIGCFLMMFWQRGHIAPIIFSCCSASTLSELANSEHMHTFRFSESVTLMLTVGVILLDDWINDGGCGGCTSLASLPSPFSLATVATADIWFVWCETIESITWGCCAGLFSLNLLFNLIHSNNTLQNSWLLYRHGANLFSSTNNNCGDTWRRCDVWSLSLLLLLLFLACSQQHLIVPWNIFKLILK